MHTHEIPQDRWSSYLATLSNQAVQRPVSVRVEGLDVGDQTLGEHMPLVGISCEEKGSEAGAIEITLSRPGGEANMTHEVLAPDRLFVREDDAGRVQVLDIESKAQVKTLVMFEGWEEIPEKSS